ncbi:hypothetical protein EIP86_010377 [Pleurotus ostreatoroseus]|nr:hypothetical protein EIP86_010377 [Pleurotus ostreatoroseus]
MAPLHNPRTTPKRVPKTPFGTVLERSVQTFFGDILPPIRYGLDPAQLVHHLKADRTTASSRHAITKQNRWRGFPKDPVDTKATQSVYHTFRHIEGIVKAVVDSVTLFNPEAKPSLRFEANSEAVSEPGYRTEATLPDASFIEVSGEHTWKNIAIFGEYSKGDLGFDPVSNAKKITHSMKRCMRHDPRRRFVIGFTIINCDMRLWYCDRSQLLASQPFNFISDHITVVHFFLSVLYAQPHELGWDTSMVALPDGSNFDITVRSVEGDIRIYRTMSLLSDSSTLTTLGKATRVWKVVRLEEGKLSGSAMVLKDYWVGSTDPREGTIAQLIARDIAALKDGLLASSPFVHVEWHGDVILEDHGRMKLDCTRLFPDKSEVTDILYEGEEPAVYPQASKRTSTDGALSASKNLSHVNKLLALRYMHQAQWVHRDISTGNILLEGDQTFLIDFEFAQKVSDEASPRIGTDFFRAIEPDTGHYKFTPSGEPPQEPEISKERFIEIVFNDLPVEEPPRPPLHENEADFLAPVRYNPLHDLESLWWVAVYFLLKWEVEGDTSEESPQPRNAVNWNREKQRKYADEVFYDRFSRFQIMTMPRIFNCNVLGVINPILYNAVKIMERIRLALVERYGQLEQDPASIDCHCADGFHEKLAAGFRQIAELPDMSRVALIPLAASVPPAPLNTPTLSFEVSQGDNRATQGTEVQASKEVPKKTESPSRRLRKIAGTAVHRYNLRPRPGRK